jgi:type IV pilus assembly protein PilC
VQGILNGDSLSEALRAQNEFSQYDIQSVRIGEESGLIEVVLNDLSDYYSRRISQQRQIKSALSYPILVLLTTIVSLGFMLGYIVPIFEDVFSRFNTDLPALTRTIIRISRFTQDNSKYILVLTFLSVSLLFYLRKKEWVRRYSAIIVLKIPVIGKIVLLSYYVKFCQTLKLLSASKVHLIEAITLIRKMVRFYPLEKALMQVEKDITRGIPLSKAMESTQFFDKKMIALTRVGEEVNKLDSVYQQLLKQSSEDLETRVKAMNSLLEPVMIILVGCIVAIILVSMYLPIFKLGTGVF